MAFELGRYGVLACGHIMHLDCRVLYEAYELELYTVSVFLVSIWSVFLSIYRTDTGGELGQYFSVLKLAGTPFSTKNMYV